MRASDCQGLGSTIAPWLSCCAKTLHLDVPVIASPLNDWMIRIARLDWGHDIFPRLPTLIHVLVSPTECMPTNDETQNKAGNLRSVSDRRYDCILAHLRQCSRLILAPDKPRLQELLACRSAKDAVVVVKLVRWCLTQHQWPA